VRAPGTFFESASGLSRFSCLVRNGRAEASILKKERRLGNGIAQGRCSLPLTDIQAKCGDTDKVEQCEMEKRTSLSQPFQTVINALQQAYEGLAALRCRPVLSSDGKELGQVVEVNRALTAEFTPSRLTSVGGLASVPKS